MKKNILVFVISMICLSSYGFEPVKVCPRQLIVGNRMAAWKFSAGDKLWSLSSQCTGQLRQGVFDITTIGEDPSILSPAIELKGPLVLKMRMRAATAGSGEIFWTTKESPEWNSTNSCSFRLIHDDKWHEYEVLIDTPQTVTQLRFDPGSGVGNVWLDWIRILSGKLHPIEVLSVKQENGSVFLQLRNHDAGKLRAIVNGRQQILEANGDCVMKISTSGKSAFEVLPVRICSKDLPEIQLNVCVYNNAAKSEWIIRKNDKLTVKFASDGSGAEIFLDGRAVAVMAPILFADGKVPAMKCDDISQNVLVFRGDDCTAKLELNAEGLRVEIESSRTVEGPVVRVFGTLEQGLLAGVEYLGKGESSSSTLDMEIPAHWRVTPDPIWITMPLMACITEKVSAAVLWDDMTLQPVYAVPNFLDGTDDNRMAVRGKKIGVTVLVKPTMPLEEVILWAVKQKQLPPLPAAPRTAAQQKSLLMLAFDKSVAGDGGWGHAAETRWERREYSDIASSIGRLTGKWSQLSAIVSDGAQIRNDAAYFMSGNAERWLHARKNEAQTLLAQQQPDGSFRYDGPFRRGHHEDTASGYNAWRAMLLLDYARLTGNTEARDGGLKCLEFMKKFRTPRGAQTHELSLHTPDLLAAAYLVRAYVIGYELTQNPDYLSAARKWALSGLPFTYQWSALPVMAYSTIPVFGATSWREPNWIGLPVQWCGVVYAYGLTLLDKYDKTLDWKKLANGILITAEQMQYPDGKFAGCLPDFFLLREQRRAGPSINPAIIVSLQLALQGHVDSLSVARDDNHLIIAPFPVTIKNGAAVIKGVPGTEYQVIIDGKKIINVKSKGVDLLQLDFK